MIKQLTLCFFLLSSCFIKAEAPNAKVVGKELESLIKALYVPDYDLLLKHTHDSVLQLTGGEETFKATLKQTHELMKQNNVTISAVKTGEKLDYFTGEKNEYFFIPTELTLKVGENEQKAAGHQLGIRKKGTEVWKYIDCSMLTKELVSQLIPDYPKDKELPAKG